MAQKKLPKSEFEIIEKLTKDFKLYKKSIYKGIGDDVAVIKKTGGFEIITVDTLVENDHFNVKWSKSEEVGVKAVESNVSDIASSGGTPLYMFISLTVPGKIQQKWLSGLFKGIKKSCDKYKISLIGGDTTHGTEINIAVTLIGETKKVCLRSGSKVGDIICCTGDLGASTAGLELLRNKNMKILTRDFPYLYKRHITPQARLNESVIISKYCSAMIDVSDGLASEVRHICSQSRVGAIVYKEKINMHHQTKEAAKLLTMDPYKFALSGGEDFELVFTISKPNLLKLKRYYKNFFEVGEIISKSKGINLISNNKKGPLPGGYDHFN